MHYLVINGWSAPNKAWDGFFEDIPSCESYDILDLDQVYPVDKWCETIRHLVKPKTLLIGWSLGGMLALDYASREDPRILGLVVLMAAPSFVDRSQGESATGQLSFGMSTQMFDQFRSVLTQDGEEAALSRFQFLLSQGEPSPRKSMVTLRQAYEQGVVRDKAMARHTLQSTLDWLGDYQIAQGLSAIRVPTLMHFAEHDAVVPVPDRQKLLGLFSESAQVEFSVSELGGHLPMGIQSVLLKQKINELTQSISGGLA